MSTDAATAVCVSTPERVVSHTSFSDFFTQHWSDVVGYCASLIGDRSAAEDLTQEAFTRVYARFPLLREPRAYCFRVVTNLSRDHLRRSRHEVSRGDVVIVAGSVGVDPHLLDAVRRLRPQLREVVLLHYFADLPLTEVAKVVRRPAGTVGRQLHEARSALATALGNADD